jgi:hypothetical protein
MKLNPHPSASLSPSLLLNLLLQNDVEGIESLYIVYKDKDGGFNAVQSENLEPEDMAVINLIIQTDAIDSCKELFEPSLEMDYDE